MSDQSVVIQLGAQDAEMVAAWQRARQGPQAMERELEKVAKAGKKAGQETKDAFEDLQSSFGGVAAGLTGVNSLLEIGGKVTNIFRKEVEALIQRQQEALG